LYIIRASCPAIPIIIRSLRQARQDRLELVDDLSLSCSIVHSRLVVCITRADGNVAVASSDQDNIRLPRQARATAPFGIASAQKTSVDASKDVLELARVAALGFGYSGKVDVQEGVCREVWLSRVDDSRGNIQSQVSIDLAVERSRRVPCSRISCYAREGDGWDLSRLCRECSGADCAGEGNLNGNIATDVRSGQSEFRLCAVPELGGSDIDSLLDRGDRERVDVV